MSPRRGIRRVLTHFYSDSISVRATRRPKGRRDALENGGGGGLLLVYTTRLRGTGARETRKRERKRSRFERERGFGSRASGVTFSRNDLAFVSIVALRNPHAVTPAVSQIPLIFHGGKEARVFPRGE